MCSVRKERREGRTKEGRTHETVDNTNDFRRWHIRRKKIRMAWDCPSIPPKINIPPLISGYETKVFGLRLRTLSHASTNPALEFMRTPHTLVPILQIDGHPDRVSDSIPAPVGSDARLDGTERLPVRLTRFESRVDEQFPDLRQVLLVGSK